ncbi:TetR/AcrR family transcriptional regulator [Myxococcota bacterium]|nr:TetR/AcrR family transcriptional regulator [Myxococcota bacterium]
MSKDIKRRNAPSASRPLSRGKIAKAALNLVRTEGAGGVSMRQISTSLNVDVAALYRHFSDRNELFREVAQLASDNVQLEVLKRGTWETRILHLCAQIRDTLRDHPELSLHGGGSIGAAPFNARAFGMLTGILYDAGVRHSDLLLAAQVILDSVTAVAQNEELHRATPPEENRIFRKTFREHMPEEVSASRPRAKVGSIERDYDGYFDFSMGVVLKGLGSRVVPSTSRGHEKTG